MAGDFLLFWAISTREIVDKGSLLTKRKYPLSAPSGTVFQIMLFRVSLNLGTFKSIKLRPEIIAVGGF
jgi:hypothetical protein